jgi:O-antigen ligase
MASVDFKVSTLTLKELNSRIVAFATIVLLFSYQLLTITGQKPHYIIFVFLCLVLIFFNLTPNFNRIKFVYLTTLSLSIIHFVLNKELDAPFVLSLLNYIVIPIVFLNRNFQDFDLNRILVFFQWFTLLCFLGLLVQIVGFESRFFGLEYAWTNEVLHERYGSFAGGTLVLGYIASISSIYSIYILVYERKKSTYSIGILIVSLLTLILAQSRRYYIFVFVIGVLIYLFNINKKYSLKKFFKVNGLIAASIIIIFSSLFFIKDSSFYLMRFFSTFDFVGDSSNVLRVIKWLDAIQKFLDNFWFGTGAGALGTIGKNIEDTSIQESAVAESYYLKAFVEGGIFFGLAFIGIMFMLLSKAIRFFRNKEKALAAYIFFFFFLDCFMSMTLEYALASMLFWISISIMLKEVPNEEKQSV